MRISFQLALFSVLSSTLVFSQTKIDDKVSRVINYCKESNQKGALHGGILIAKGQEILYKDSFGTSLTDKPNTDNTIFNIASMGKTFTGVAISQLIEKGLLSVDTKIIDVLPEYRNIKAAKEVSVYHLLTHTSGIPELFQMNLGIDPMNPSQYSHEELVKFFSNKKLKYKPGKKWSYTNSGFVVLGRIIEKISGLSYCDYIQNNILKPSEMASTGCGFGAGGAESSLLDMFNFSQALQFNKLLSKPYADEAMSRKEKVEENVWCGYGFFGTERDGGKEVSHSGGVPGQIQCQLLMMVDSGYTIVVYSNNPKGFEAYQELRKVIRENLS